MKLHPRDLEHIQGYRDCDTCEITWYSESGHKSLSVARKRRVAYPGDPDVRANDASNEGIDRCPAEGERGDAVTDSDNRRMWHEPMGVYIDVGQPVPPEWRARKPTGVYEICDPVEAEEREEGKP